MSTRPQKSLSQHHRRHPFPLLKMQMIENSANLIVHLNLVSMYGVYAIVFAQTRQEKERTKMPMQKQIELLLYS